MPTYRDNISVAQFPHNSPFPSPPILVPIRKHLSRGHQSLVVSDALYLG